jgi:hypothetical protein
LIARFYLPQEGQVLIDGHDTRQFTGDSLHHQMGIVLAAELSCSPARFSTTSASASRKRYRPGRDRRGPALDCLDSSNRCRTGCKRRLASAGRAFAGPAAARLLRPGHAGRSADSDPRRSDQQRRYADGNPHPAALAKLLSGRTSFVVAHRLSTIRSADQILVLENGYIIQRGTHAELLAQAANMRCCSSSLLAGWRA